MPPADAVSESAVLARRLPRVTFVAKRLEVVNAPEQVRISLVRPDVIYVRGGRYLVMPQAFLAQRMRGDVPVTKLLPPIAVASGVRVSFVQKATPLGSGSAFGADFLVPRRSFLFVPLAVLVSQRYGGLTAWISADVKQRHKRMWRRGFASGSGSITQLRNVRSPGITGAGSETDLLIWRKLRPAKKITR